MSSLEKKKTQYRMAIFQEIVESRESNVFSKFAQEHGGG